MMHAKVEFADLAEFFARWPAEREKMVNVSDCDALTSEERGLLKAMIFVIDRVGPDDLGD